MSHLSGKYIPRPAFFNFHSSLIGHTMTQKPHLITRLWFYVKDHRRTIVLAALTVLVYFFQPARDF